MNPPRTLIFFDTDLMMAFTLSFAELQHWPLNQQPESIFNALAFATANDLHQLTSTPEYELAQLFSQLDLSALFTMPEPAPWF